MLERTPLYLYKIDPQPVDPSHVGQGQSTAAQMEALVDAESVRRFFHELERLRTMVVGGPIQQPVADHMAGVPPPPNSNAAFIYNYQSPGHSTPKPAAKAAHSIEAATAKINRAEVKVLNFGKDEHCRSHDIPATIWLRKSWTVFSEDSDVAKTKLACLINNGYSRQIELYASLSNEDVAETICRVSGASGPISAFELVKFQQPGTTDLNQDTWPVLKLANGAPDDYEPVIFPGYDLSPTRWAERTEGGALVDLSASEAGEIFSRHKAQEINQGSDSDGSDHDAGNHPRGPADLFKGKARDLGKGKGKAHWKGYWKGLFLYPFQVSKVDNSAKASLFDPALYYGCKVGKKDKKPIVFALDIKSDLKLNISMDIKPDINADVKPNVDEIRATRGVKR
ncbi:hypothetical protein QFC21_001207 [Naganishia friedmannii]|uniref:Uncharacterized protein n=1 Tax=Naganishia friedmannii TaxID=89922 RepID=A0ACC2W9L4_9TREE|nr:hypothetical protein QFC21_001207 [Naganishia friedmannii]